jgi:hypothetical protein
LPIFAYRYIIKNKVGERVKVASDGLIKENGLESANPMISVGVVPNSTHIESFDISSSKEMGTESVSFYATIPSWATPIDKVFHNFIDRCVPTSLDVKYPWLKRAIPYMLTVGWVDFNTWGIISAVTPFAIAHASSGTGSQNLSIAYQVAAVALTLGDMSTAVFKLPIFYCLIIFSVFCCTVYAAAISSTGFQSSAAAPLLIMVYSLERFLGAHVVTSTYRAIATHFPPEHRQAASRAVGICDQICTTFGTIFSTVLVAVTFNCHSNNDDSN